MTKLKKSVAYHFYPHYNIECKGNIIKMKIGNGKMKRKTKVLSILVLYSILFLSVIPVQAKKNKNYWPKQSDEITADAAILMDVDTGTILYKKNINTKHYPASITKILTVLVAVENSRMDEVVTFSHDSVYKTEGSGISRDVGEKMTMEQCLYAVMLESANECAYAVAEHIAGSMQKFVKMMNDRAKQLGCKNTNFANPHGLPDENHYVTAKDMAVIARAAYENETFRLLCGTKRYTIPPTNKHREPTYLVNHHKMLYPKDTAEYLYDYCTGGKTGYTIAAGSTLVTYAQKEGMTLLTVILKGTSPNYWNETRSLLEFGFENFNLCNVAEHFGSDESSEEEKLDTLNTNDPYAQIDPQAKIILPKSVNFNKTSMEISYENLPDNSLAQLVYTYGKRKIGVADIVRTNTLIDKSDVSDYEQADLSQAEETSSEETAASDETVTSGESASSDNTVSSDGQKQQPDQEREPAKNEGNQKSGSDSAKGNFIDRIVSGVKNFKINKVFDNFNPKQTFENITGSIKDFFVSMKDHFSLQHGIVIGGIVLGVVLIIIFKVIYDKYYIIRQRLANYRNHKQQKKKYTVIRDSRRGRKRRNR